MAEEVSAAEAISNWPNAVIAFFEDRLEWKRPTGRVNLPLIPTIEDVNGTDGDPQSVLCKLTFIFIMPIKLSNNNRSSSDATFVGDTLFLWLQWLNGNCKWVSAKEANKKWPQIVIRFYQENMSFD